MNGAPWWAVLAAAAIGAAAGVTGAVWAARVQRRAASRAGWFRRLQWAWELTGPDQTQRTTAGMTVMDYVAKTADPRDASMILAITPIAREIGRLMSDYQAEPSAVDIASGQGDTGLQADQEGDSNGG